MQRYRKILTGTSLLSGSLVVSQGCSFVRNVILARFLAKADFGVAATLAMIITLFEMTNKMALGQQVIQSKHGDDDVFLDSVQFTQLVLGILSALLIAAFAWPLSHLFHSPQEFGPIASLALIPLFNGLGSLDIYRRARGLRFGFMALTEAAPQIVTTLAAWPLAAYFRDYRAVLILLLGNALLSSVVTHLVAQRNYSPKYVSQWMRESLKFGLPQLLSGFAQFGNFQGDSMVIATAYSMAQLGEYSVAMSMAMAPALAVLRVGGSISLPLLSEVREDLPRLGARYGLYCQLLVLIGCTFSLSMLLCGEMVIRLIFGSKYAGIGLIACWLTIAQALRTLRGATVSAAMAQGDTMINLISTLSRLSGLLIAIGVGLLKANLLWFAVTGFIGECIALSVAISLLAIKHRLPPRLTIFPAALGGMVMLLVGAIKYFFGIGSYSYLNWLLLPLCIAFAVGIFSACFPGFRERLVDLFNHLRRRLYRPSMIERQL